MTVKKGLQLTRVELTAQLQRVHDQLLEGMRELISRKDYSTAEQILRLVEKQLNGLIMKLSGPEGVEQRSGHNSAEELRSNSAPSCQYAETAAVPRR